MKSIQLHEEDGLRRYLLVMDKGDEAFAQITGFARDRRIRAASLTAIGAASKVTLGYFDLDAGDYVYTTYDEQVELASCTGDIAIGDDDRPQLHAHVVVGRRDGTALAGHLKVLSVFPTMEVTLAESPAHLVKRIDPATGLALMALDATLDDAPVPAPDLPRGVNHIGITVPDIEQATRFFAEAFGARIAYDGLTTDDEPRQGPDVERQLGLPGGATIIAQRMMQIGVGPGFEMFQLTHTDPQRAAGLADYGWGHVSLLVDDMDAVLERARRAGAEPVDVPHPNSRHEDTPGNSSIYLRAPWGSLIELQCLPNGHWYGSGSQTDVWSPPRADPRG